MMNFKLITRTLAIVFLLAAYVDGITAEVRTSSGTPQIGDTYQNVINLDSKRKIILPEGLWQVNNSFDDKEKNWHASWRVVTLTNSDQQTPFRLIIVRYFSQSTSKWLIEECEKNSSPYAFGQDTSGSKNSRSVCSQFFYWANPQELISTTLPKLFIFHFSKALGKLDADFRQTLSRDQIFLELTASQNGGLYLRQEILIDTNKLDFSGDEFKRTFSSNSDKSNIRALINWRHSYAQSMSQAYLDATTLNTSAYALKITPTDQSSKPTAKTVDLATNNSTGSVSEENTNSGAELASEASKLEAEKKLLQERKQLAEERRKLEEERKRADLEAIQRQKELIALQEQRMQLEKQQEEKNLAEENKKKEDAEKREAAEKMRAAELAKLAEEKRLAAEAKRAGEEERKKMEAYKKTPPVIEVTQSEPDEFGAVILDISVSKPTKSFSINGEDEGASKDGKYKVKRILKKLGPPILILQLAMNTATRAAIP